MKRSCLLLCAVMGFSSLASAQAPADAMSSFLEKRVPDELATEGVVLSRQNLGLQIEQLADKWLVSLVDLTTRRVAASTKVDALPADREAAVAAMTHVVAELAEQITGRPAREAGAADRELAELKLKRSAIHFGDGYEVQGKNSSQRWIAYRGEQGPRLSIKEFYREVGRNDLVASYDRRQATAAVFFVAGIAAFIGAGAWAIDQGTDVTPRPMYVTLVGAASWTIAFIAAPQPLRENEARALADAHNQNLRRQLGLPVVSQAPRLRDIKIAPYVGEHDGGLVLAAKF